MENNWTEASVGDVLDLITGYAFKSKDFIESGIPVIKIKNVKSGFFSEHEFSFVDKGFLQSKSDKLALYEDILISMSGNRHDGNPETWVGKVAPFRKHKQYLINQRVGALRVKDSNLLNYRFLGYLLSSWSYQELFISIATSSGGQANLSPKQILEAPVKYPPLTEQKAIAHILGSLDDKIELNRRMNETLEAMAQALFKSWFVDFDPVIDNALAAGNDIPEELKERADIREALGDARKPLPEEIQNLFPSEFEHTEEMGWIPKGWTVSTVESVIEINPTVKLPKNTVAPFVDMKALPTTGYSVGEIIEKPYAGGAKFQNGDILLARITPCLENGKTAIADFLNGDQIGFGSTEFIILRGQGFVGTPFVACLSRNGKFRDHCIQSMVGSSGRQRVQNACFSNFFLSLPKENDLLKEFHSRTVGSFNKLTKHSEQSRVLTKLRDTLLPQLLSGEMRIPEAEKLVEGLQ